MANLNRIVNINIDIKTPAVSAASFDNLLIIGPAPATAPTTAPPAVGSYTDLEGVTEAGWIAVGNNADPVGVAARIAFSQNPRPAKIFIAVQQKVEGYRGNRRHAESCIKHKWLVRYLPCGCSRKGF